VRIVPADDYDLGDISPADFVREAIERGIFVFDLETSGLDPLNDHIEGIAFYIPPVNIVDELTTCFQRQVPARRGRAVRAWYPFKDGTMRMRVRDLDDPTREPWYENVRPAMDQAETMEVLRPLFEDNPDVVSIAHNLKFDTSFMIHSPGTERGFTFKNRIADSLLLDFLGDENEKKYGLKQRVKKLLGHDMTTYEDVQRYRRQFALSFMASNVKPLGVYAMDDTEWTYGLFEVAYRRIMEEDPGGQLEKIYWLIDMEISQITEEMESAGCNIDDEWLRQVTEALEVEKETILTRIEARLGFPLNPKSVPQVSTVLFGPKAQGYLELPTKHVPFNEKSGYFATGGKEIGHLKRADPLVKDILDWRSKDTIQSSFSVKIVDIVSRRSDRRLHAKFNQSGTKIFRFSSSDPINFMNQPRKKELIRKAFCGMTPREIQAVYDEIARIDSQEEKQRLEDEMICLYASDYSQVELRVAAHLSGDPNMIEVYSTVGGCKADDGKPCANYQVWACETCGKAKAPTALFTPPFGETPNVCPACGSKKIEHKKQCRHVDIHTRTAEDVDVERNPLSKCLDGSTLVRTASGVKTIESLIPTTGVAGQHSPIKVCLADGRGGYTRSTTAIFRHDRPTKIVVTKRAVVIATEDHRFQVIGDHGDLDPSTPGYQHVPGRSLIETRNLKAGMKLPVAKFHEAECDETHAWHDYADPQIVKLNPFTKEIGDGPADLVLNEDWAYFAGMFHGDGCAAGNGCVITHGHTDEYEPWRQIVRAACDKLGLPTVVTSDKRSTRIGSRIVRRYFAALGLCKEAGKSGFKTMSVPWWVLDGGPKIIWSYLAGLFDTDGTVGKETSGTVSVTMKSPEFAGQIAFLLRELGMPVLVQPQFNKTYERWYYTIHVLGDGLERFQRYCPLRHPGKRDRLSARNRTIKRRCAPTDDEVVLVLDGGERTVYDFNVENDDHLYLQGGLIGHNNLNFGNLYRIGPARFCQYADLYDANGEPMLDYSREIIKGWYAAYPGIAPFHQRTEASLRKNGWIAFTLAGRRHRLEQSRVKNEYEAITQGIQFQVSGSAQDIIKIAMRNIRREREKIIANARPAARAMWRKFRFLIQVHDEIVLEGPYGLRHEIVPLIERNMQGAANLKVPLEAAAKYGFTWDDVH